MAFAAASPRPSLSLYLQWQAAQGSLIPGEQRAAALQARRDGIGRHHRHPPPICTPRAPQVEHITMEDDHFLFTSGEQLCSPLLWPLKGVSAGRSQRPLRPLIGTLAVRADQMAVAMRPQRRHQLGRGGCQQRQRQAVAAGASNEFAALCALCARLTNAVAPFPLCLQSRSMRATPTRCGGGLPGAGCCRRTCCCHRPAAVLAMCCGLQQGGNRQPHTGWSPACTPVTAPRVPPSPAPTLTSPPFPAPGPLPPPPPPSPAAPSRLQLADQVSDAVLDACLEQDPESKVACETATKTNMVRRGGR